MAVTLLTITEFIGRFHPVLVHLPIGVLLMAILLQWLSRWEKYKVSQSVLKIMLMFGMLSALLSCITGYLLSRNGEYEEGLVSLHMWMGIGVTVGSFWLLLKVGRVQHDIVYKALPAVLLVLILMTGHLGGSLTHGSNYLTAALFNDSQEATAVQKPVANVQEAAVYTDVVQPMLQTRCYSCHGPNKQKGGLRMDSPEFLIKGGKNGAAITGGKAEESELIKRLLLPREAEHHMPPKEKPQFSEKQIALLHWWIDQGADFQKKVKELPQPENIRPVLLALQGGGNAEKKVADPVPATPVEPADPKAIKVLSDKGVVVLPVAQNSHYLMANFITAVDISNKDMALLLPLKKQLIWLKLGNTTVTDEALASVSQCKNIMVLDLNNTRISDKGLGFVKSLDSLQTLNLVGTKVSAPGLLQLKSLQRLQSVYLYQSHVNKSDWAMLKKALPKTYLDSGGYSLAFIPTDTMQVLPGKK